MVDVAQQKRTVEGNAFEVVVYDMISQKTKECLYKNGKTIYLGKKLGSFGRNDIRKQMTFDPAINEGFVGDIDIVIYDEELKRPDLIISTKKSSRERVYQVAFTLQLYREVFPKIQLWYVTNDNVEKNPEFGTIDKPNKPRQLALHLNMPCYVNAERENYFGGVVKPIALLDSDIVKVFCR